MLALPCPDVCIDIRRKMCIDMCIDKCIDMRTDRCIDMCIDTRTVMCVDMHAYRNLPRRLTRDTSRPVQLWHKQLWPI